MTDTSGPYPQDVMVRYTVDSSLSSFTVQAFVGGLLAAFGHNPVIAIPDFSGEVQVGEDLQQASLVLTIVSSSLKVASDMSDKDRLEIERTMHERVLQTDQYPEIEYRCSRISGSKSGEGQYWVALNGDLILHGVTRGLVVSTRVTQDGERLRASGSFSILQSDYEIEPVSFAGGALKLKDELKFSFGVIARKQG